MPSLRFAGDVKNSGKDKVMDMQYYKKTGFNSRGKI